MRTVEKGIGQRRPNHYSATLTNAEKTKKRHFTEKFNIQKELLNREDITTIIQKLRPENKDNLVELSEAIFEKLDKNSLGYVKTNELIKSLLEQDKETEDKELANFYKNLNNILLTKSEEILIKLKHLQTKKWVQDINNGYMDKLKMIIYEISSQQLNDIDVDTNTISNDEKIGLSFLAKYSQVESSKQNAKDFRVVRRQSQRYESSREMTNSKNNNNSTCNNGKKLNSLSTMLSPSIIARLHEQIEKINCCDFDIFDVDLMMGKKTSIYLAQIILGDSPFIETEIIPADILKNFITEIVTHYDRVKAIYHNDLHAGDVMQTVFTIFSQGNMKEKMKLKDLDIFALLTAALCHDFKHPGTNNLFSINARTKYAQRYNDISVLENFHIAQTFKVMQHKEFNILKNFSPEEYRIIRKRMIDGILATDMANHTKVLLAAKSKAELYDIVKGRNFEKIFDDDNVDDKSTKKLKDLFDNQQILLNMIIHTADISNPGKPDKVSGQWTKRVYDEFFVQGDLEKEMGLPVSNFCDRNTTNVNKAMVGFISFVVGPTINCLTNLIPEVIDYTEYCNFNLRKHQKGAKNDERLAIIEKVLKEKEEKEKLKKKS